MSRALAALLPLLAFLLALPVAAPAVARQPPAPAAEASVETPLEDLLRQAVLVGRDDPGARAAAMQTYVTQRWDASPSAPARVADSHSGGEFNIFPLLASDLDGDGGDDVLVNGANSPDGPAVLEARSGADGAAIWSIVSDDPTGAFGWPAGADFTRDGVEDVMVVEQIETSSTVTDTCYTGEVFNCSIEEDSTYTTTLRILSGADGSVVWTVSREGAEHFEVGHSGTPVDYEAWQRVDATNSMVTPYLAGDHDGDGVADLILNARSFRWDDSQSGYDLLVAAEFDGHSTERHDTESLLVSGATGAETPIRETQDSTAAGDLRPLDRAGDALLWSAATRPDVLFSCSYSPVDGGCEQQQDPATGVIESIDGQTLQTRWARPVQPADDAFPLEEDLDGDGVADIFLSERGREGSALVERGAFVDGATGATTWSRDGRWFPEVVASIDGGAGADIVRITSQSVDGQTARLVERIDGASGDPLRLTSEIADPRGADSVNLFAQVISDVSGDGVIDIAWRAHRLDRSQACGGTGQSSASSCWYYNFATTTEVWVEDGATGQIVVAPWTFDGYAQIDGAGDLDGDGRDDLVRVEAGDGPLRLRALHGVTHDGLWSTTFEIRTEPMAAGDQDGDGLADLVLEATIDDGDARTSFLGSIVGATGAERWRIQYG